MQVNSWRLSKHHLVRKTNESLARVVSDVCGIQAQVLSAAELALRARVSDLRREDMQEALWRKHAILKTWGMRGTLHLLPSSELPLYVAALREKLQSTANWLQKDGGIKPSEVKTLSEVIGEALTGRVLTRDELAREVGRRVKLRPRTRKYLMSAWGVLLSPAAYEGNLVFGENIGFRVRFANPHDWIGTWEEPTPMEAKAKLFRRFLDSYGPSTMRDFRHWWGGARVGMDGLETLSGDLEVVESDGFKGLMSRQSAEEARGLDPARAVNLLPSFDCYAMFYSPRDAFVPGTHRARIFRQTAGWNYPAVVIDGAAAGIWSLRRGRRQIEIAVDGFRAFQTREKKGIENEAEDIGRYYEAPAELIYRAVGQ